MFHFIIFVFIEKVIYFKFDTFISGLVKFYKQNFLA